MGDGVTWTRYYDEDVAHLKCRKYTLMGATAK